MVPHKMLESIHFCGKKPFVGLPLESRHLIQLLTAKTTETVLEPYYRIKTIMPLPIRQVL